MLVLRGTVVTMRPGGAVLDQGKPSPNYLKLFAPTWVAQLSPAPLTPAEQQAADQL